jgi:hypothetical protein
VTRVNLTTGEYEHLQNCLWGESVYLVGSGPSLIGYDYSRLKGKTTIGVNHGLFELVNAGCEPKFHVFLDQRFLQEAGIQDHQGHIGFDKLPAYCVTSANSMISPRVGKLAVISAQNRKFETDPRRGFYSPRNSMAFAISVASYMGASEIYLLGLDCRFISNAQAAIIARSNGNEKKAKEIESRGIGIYGHSTTGERNHTKDSIEHANTFEYMQALFYNFVDCPAKIYNCSEISKVEAFERRPLP